jgi:hypothetical protein
VVLRLAGLVFGVIQLLLVLRLALPFVHVPGGLQGYVPGLITVTDWLITPFNFVVRSFDLGPVSHDLSRLGGALPTGLANQIDAGLIVAIVGWAIVAGIVSIVLRLVFRAI